MILFHCILAAVVWLVRASSVSFSHIKARRKFIFSYREVFMTALNGLFVIGEIVGVRESSGVSRDTHQRYSFHFVGVKTVRTSSYGGLVESITEVRLTDAQVADGLSARARDFVGQIAAIKVYPTRAGNGVQLSLSNDPDSIQQVS